MVHADYLFLLTDVDGLYLSNPRKHPDAKFLEVVSSVAEARLEGREPTKTLLSYRLLYPPVPGARPTNHALPFTLFISFASASLHNPVNRMKLG